MKVSKYFVVTVLIIFIVAFVVHYFVTIKSSTVENVSSASTLDAYLITNFSFGLHLTKKVEDVISVFCDNEIEGDATPLPPILFACQNKNPVHKIVIGSARGEESYESIVKSIGNEQLYWKNAIDDSSESGRMVCRDWVEVKGYNNVTSGINCTTTSADGNKLYSSIIFLEPGNNKKRKVFMAVVNTLQTSSTEKTELEIISLLSNQKISSFGRFVKFVSFLRKDSVKIGSILEISSDDSLESGRLDKSASSNFVTLTSGDGIDGEVCDASKTGSCYPVYCNSATAVWGKYLSRCVEPDVPVKLAVEGTLCLGSLPIWDGSKCRALVGDIISSNFCSIVIGNNSCDMKFIWSVDSPQKKVEVRYLGAEPIVISTATSGSLSYSFPFNVEPQVVGLFEGDKKLSEGKFVTKCESGGFDDVSKKCVNPTVSRASFIGEYTVDAGFLVFTCNKSDSYVVTYVDKEMIMATGTYSQEVRVVVNSSGNYLISCSQGNFTGPSVARYFNGPPLPPSSIILKLSPQAVTTEGTTTIAWNILYPREECSLRAKSYCKATGCTLEQRESEEIINQILEEENIDTSKQEMPINIQESLKKASTKNSEEELRAIGKKTIKITQTTDFIVNCGEGNEVKRRMYTSKVQRSSEQ